MTGSTNPTSVTMDGTKSVTAHFALDQFPLTSGGHPVGGGTVTGGGTYDHGTVVDVWRDGSQLPLRLLDRAGWPM